MTNGEDIIFVQTDVAQRSTEELANELAQGLDPSVRPFLLEAIAELRERLTPKRFAHSVSVSRTAKKLAALYGVDVELATKAGLVHDWDKAYRGEELRAHALEVGLEVGDDFDRMEPLLHGVTAARALPAHFPELEPEVLQAIERHTSGAVDMSPLDIVVYVADMIEPSRAFESLEPLRALVGEVTLDELFSACFKATVSNLVLGGRYLHPLTADIWNACVASRRYKRFGR